MHYRFGPFELRVPERELLRDGRPLAIEPKVLDLLAYMVEHRDRALGRDELISAVWGRSDVADGTLAQAVLRLRKTLATADGLRNPVRTVPRHGYRWVAPTESVAVEGGSEAEAERSHADPGVPTLAGSPAIPSSPQVPRRRAFAGMLALLVALAAIVLIGLFRLRDASIPPPQAGPAEADVRLAILPLVSAQAADELEDAGMIELLRRHLVARAGAPEVLSTATVVSFLKANRGKPPGQWADALQALRVSHVLEVDLAHDASGYRLEGNLVAANARSAIGQVRAANLEEALERFTNDVLGKLDAAAPVAVDSAIHGGDRLADALRLASRGRTRDAYEVLRVAHADAPTQIDLLVELAHLECALEMTAACDRHLDEALSSPGLGAWSRASVHLDRASRRLAELRLDQAREEIEAAAQAAQATSDNLLEARIVLARQHLAAVADEGDTALDLARRALTLFRVAADRGGQAAAQIALGDLAAQDGHHDEALADYREAYALFDSEGDQAGVARAGARMARALGHLGRFGEAGKVAHAAQAAASRQQDPLVLRDALDSLAWSLLQSGRLGEAREAAHAGLALLDPANNPRQALRLQSLLGFIDAAGGRYRNAMQAWERALQAMPDSAPGVGADSLRLAIVYAALNAGELERAGTEAARLRADAGRSADADVASFAEHAEALLAARRGEHAAAARLYARVWKRARDTGTLNQQLLADYSDVLFELGELDAVESLLGESDLPETEGHLVQLVRARYLLRRDRLDEAQAAFDSALRLAAERYSPLLDTSRAELARARSQGNGTPGQAGKDKSRR
ncbi:winged helix-turn-helix domain-containing protein [Dokdonella immobilis]|uniref:DNA-binding winged helix-turn-helix (WHTH) domain-containing protein n=1 Tax=Dokdonella immobilis TaxID=578942 RepID=A0A1I4YV88_9GAMM|nr:transcriptional regulator [Dokdonella immobilis]SFN41683.1 DNA-binding winged helix-turn-helix (wHTH) domain-containing protein [Dokdonella immobilis]